MKAYYSDFVTHCLRFYSSHSKPNYFKTEADRKNWLAVHNALEGLDDSERAMILTIYREGDTIADNVYHLAKSKNIRQDGLWKLIADVERKVAKRRGLL